MKILPFVSLLVFLAAAMPVVYALPSIGVSHYNTEAIIYIGETKEFPVGRIYNTGDAVLNACCRWVPDGDCGLPVKVKPEAYVLKPGDSFQVMIVVEALSEDYIGNYSGTVEVLCEPLNVTGNPVSPAGSLYVKICVLQYESHPESRENEGGATYSHEWIIIPCLALGSAAIFALANKSRKKKQSVKAVAARFLFHR